MLLKVEMLLVVNDKEKWEQRFPKMRVEELNRVNSRQMPRNANETMVKAGATTLSC